MSLIPPGEPVTEAEKALEELGGDPLSAWLPIQADAWKKIVSLVPVVNPDSGEIKYFTYRNPRNKKYKIKPKVYIRRGEAWMVFFGEDHW